MLCGELGTLRFVIYEAAPYSTTPSSTPPGDPECLVLFFHLGDDLLRAAVWLENDTRDTWPAAYFVRLSMGRAVVASFVLATIGISRMARHPAAAGQSLALSPGPTGVSVRLLRLGLIF